MGKSFGKWTKHKFLSQNKKLARYIPETNLLTEKTFQEFLEKYGEAIVKPSIGSLGNKIFKITDIGNDHYEIHGANRIEKIAGKKNAFDLVRQNVSKRKNIIQKVIPLAKKNDYPFDLRVMVQKEKDASEWVITGMAAKVAAKGFFITNAAREVLTVEDAINNSSINLQFLKTKNVVKELEKVSLLIAHTLQEHYPQEHEMGIDFGVDDEGRVWIIEVNMRPNISLFKVLREKSMLEEILRVRESHK